jgi:hypothetical protein
MINEATGQMTAYAWEIMWLSQWGMLASVKFPH